MNIVAATQAWLRLPTPTTETFATRVPLIISNAVLGCVFGTFVVIGVFAFVSASADMVDVVWSGL